MGHIKPIGNGKRYDIEGLDKRKQYILIDDEPAIFVTFPDNDINNMNYQATATALVRVLSIALQAGVDPGVLKKQLEESSRQKKDTPDVILTAMNKHGW